MSLNNMKPEPEDSSNITEVTQPRQSNAWQLSRNVRRPVQVTLVT